LYQVLGTLAERGWPVELLAKAHQMESFQEHIPKLRVDISLEALWVYAYSAGCERARISTVPVHDERR
jgi:hypothetical protein